jgi:hypothetical protein
MGIDVNEEVFGSYAFYSGLLVAKIFFMVILTARQRFTKKVNYMIYNALRNKLIEL